MKTISPEHYALSVCVAAAMLAGCGGSTQFQNPTAQTPVGNAITPEQIASPSFAMPERMGPNSSGAEVLTGKATLHRCHPGGSFEFFRRFSHAHGKATGPYPGTFTASGGWGISEIISGNKIDLFWGFSERFIITSGASKISGTIEGMSDENPFPGCTSFGPETLQYTSNYGDGNADIQIIEKGDFSETLDGL
ncbi:MAG: hypothetical protein WCB99_16025 [Candidatus Cybelea sp.]